eukprot:CAMPEP_0202688178 /NCGR_PEP_ID=MMETSP1385-20130828/3713_1 /ASSEMBLY_ACC=CAM_ASM_000861 /TAXON_ID=933848 /ORGANISM="Elphidium margaritaceum" /LENGTH=970 /DNA_ID=CAMNT_0049343085 /DNA_START=34 /DNA_END=2946 /DNA_ORIENTATION=+
MLASEGDAAASSSSFLQKPSIAARFARQYISKRHSSSSAENHANQKKRQKTVLVFVNSSRSLLKKKKRSASTTTGTTATTTATMSNVHALRQQYEKKRSDTLSMTNGATMQSIPSYSDHSPARPLPHRPPNGNKIVPIQVVKPYIVADDAERHHHHNHHHHHGAKTRNDHFKSMPPPSRSKSPIALHSSNGSLQHNVSISPQPPQPSPSPSPLLADAAAYSGVCGRCQHEAPLLEFMTASNRHSHLTELRDKLTTVEALATALKQEILAVQSKMGDAVQQPMYLAAHTSANATASAGVVGGGALGGVGGRTSLKKHVSNPFQEDVSSPSRQSYHLDNLTLQQQQALSLLNKHSNITFPLKGTAMTSPQESIGYFEKFKEMRRRFVNQEFFVRMDLERATFTVHTKQKLGANNKDASGRQYRQVRSFSSLNGAEFESAKDNVLKVWFKNTRGYFLLSFAAETEANTVLTLINIVVNNELYQQDALHQIVWSSYVDKRGKRMRMYSQKFLCLIKLEIKLYKTHVNFLNGEEPSLRIHLLDCEIARDKKEVKFMRKKNAEPDAVSDNEVDSNKSATKSDVLLSIKLNSEIERDDFLTLCAQTLGKAIQQKAAAHSSSNQLFPAWSPSNTLALTAAATGDDNDDSGTEVEDSEFYHYNDENDEKSDYRFRSTADGADDVGDDDDLFVSRVTATMTLRGPPTDDANLKNRSSKNAHFLEQLQNTPRMYGASHHKALDRLAKKRPSDIDFIETTFNGKEIVLKSAKNEGLKTYQLLDVLGKSMISGAFLNPQLYLHKAVWEQNKVVLVNYEKKLEVFGLMVVALSEMLRDISIDRLKSEFTKHSASFHERLKKCELKLRDAQNSLADFITKHEQKARGKGAVKWIEKFADVGRAKVFDNQPYRDLIYQICGHASSMQLYYIYLSKPSKKHEDDRRMLLADIKGITFCMTSFSRVVVADVKEFLSAYLRRGAKNIYE